MTQLPSHTDKKLGLVIDLDICVGCHACAVNCKEWNTSGYGAALSDQDAYGADPSGSWLNRIHSFEAIPFDTHTSQPRPQDAQIVHFPKILSALRRCALCDCLSDRRILQAY